MSEGDSTPHLRKLSILLIIGLIATLTITSVTASTITITAKPSVSSSYSYTWHTTTFENYCPLCKHSGTLIKNPKGVYERELTCSWCDADYCAVTGKDKSYNCRASLTKVHLTNYKINAKIWKPKQQEHVLDFCQTMISSYEVMNVKMA